MRDPKRFHPIPVFRCRMPAPCTMPCASRFHPTSSAAPTSSTCLTDRPTESAPRHSCQAWLHLPPSRFLPCAIEPAATAECSAQLQLFCGSKILLVADILVSGKKNVEPGTLRFGQQVAVGKPVPSAVPSFDDGVADQIWNEWGWYSVVKKNEHLGRMHLATVREPAPQGCERRTARPRSPAPSRCQTIP